MSSKVKIELVKTIKQVDGNYEVTITICNKKYNSEEVYTRVFNDPPELLHGIRECIDAIKKIVSETYLEPHYFVETMK